MKEKRLHKCEYCFVLISFRSKRCKPCSADVYGIPKRDIDKTYLGNNVSRR